MIFVTTCRCCLVIRSVASVCVSVCPVLAVTFECLEIQISFFVCRFIFIMCNKIHSCLLLKYNLVDITFYNVMALIFYVNRLQIICVTDVIH